MDNQDLEVAKMLNEYKKGTYGDIENGLYIKERLFEFERKELFDNRISVMLPKEFIDMPSELKKIKYPAEQRPQIIKMIPEGGIDLAFSMLDAMISDEQLIDNLLLMKNTLKKVNPAINMYEQDMIDDKYKKIVWMDFSNPGIDVQVYNVMFLMSAGSRILHGVFNCPIYNKEQWKPVMLEILRSVQKVNLED